MSTDDQDLTLQREALIRYGVEPEWIYEEHASGASMKRKELARLLRSMDTGHTLVVWKLDRLGRTLAGVLEVLKQIDEDGIAFVSLTEGFDTATAMGRAMMQMALVFAELERAMISERTKAGIMEAKKRGAKFGQPNKITDVKKRINWLRRQDKAGKLRDEDGDLIMKAKDLMDKLNSLTEGDEKPQLIESEETIRRWKRQGYPKLDDPIADEPLDL